MKNDINKLVFFLGGHDLEMITIKGLLDEKGVTYYDEGLSWGAKASDYKEEINKTITSGLIPVLVELTNDLGIGQESYILIDHHGEKAGVNANSTLRQAFDLLKIPLKQWTRYFELVDANDKGHIQAMINIGASKEEIMEIRQADRHAQGITDEQERQGHSAIAQMETLPNGNLTIIRCPHSKTAVVTDLLHPALGGSGYENLLIISPDEVNFYGKGDMITALDKAFPNGWYGGSLPEYGFWGHGEPVPDVTEFVKMRLS
jgi:hypothetical protein